MYSRIRAYVLLVVCACLLLTLSSCRDEDSPTPPRVFDPEIDGLAVRPSQQIDLELANRILRGETEPPAMDEEAIPKAAPVVSEAGAGLAGPGVPGAATPGTAAGTPGSPVPPALPSIPGTPSAAAPAPAGAYDYGALNDPNADF